MLKKYDMKLNKDIFSNIPYTRKSLLLQTLLQLYSTMQTTQHKTQENVYGHNTDTFDLYLVHSVHQFREREKHIQTCVQESAQRIPKTCGWTIKGIFRFCTTEYTPSRIAERAHRKLDESFFRMNTAHNMNF